MSSTPGIRARPISIQYSLHFACNKTEPSRFSCTLLLLRLLSLHVHEQILSVPPLLSAPQFPSPVMDAVSMCAGFCSAQAKGQLHWGEQTLTSTCSVSRRLDLHRMLRCAAPPLPYAAVRCPSPAACCGALNPCRMPAICHHSALVATAMIRTSMTCAPASFSQGYGLRNLSPQAIHAMAVVHVTR